MLKFGAVTKNTCSFALDDLVKWDPSNLPSEANNFFELFLEDRNGNLVDIPVLIKNFRTSDGDTPNSGSDLSDSWRFTRRFFIFDTISGID